jgi:enoyl-CoA hydratase/carnithine racemase
MAIRLSRINELALVTLDRPEVLNALNTELLRDLGAAFDQVAATPAPCWLPVPATRPFAPAPTSRS